MKQNRNNFIYRACESHKVKEPDNEILVNEHVEEFAEDIIVVSMLRAFSQRIGMDTPAMRYLEVGAAHPISNNTTYLAHVELGMTGVLVATEKAFIADLQKARVNDAVIHLGISNKNSRSTEQTAASHEKTPANGELYADNIRATGAYRIKDILQEFFPEMPPQFVSIYQPGKTLKALTDFPFAGWRPYLMQVKASCAADTDTSNNIPELLEQHGYSTVARTKSNVIAVDTRRMVDMHERKAPLTYPTQWTSSAEVDPVIQAHEYLSIDIFDTLLFRHCKSPTEVFNFLAKYGKVQSVTQFFADYRIAAERLAREDAAKTGTEDVSLDQIYSCFQQLTNCTPQQAKEIQACELQVEADLLYPTNFAQRLINHARTANKRFVITSDMYLSQDFLEFTLNAKGITGWERVFVSNEQGKTKHSASLYKDVINHFGVPADQILQIGDNPHADGKMAEKAGLKSHVILASKDLPKRSRRLHKTSHLLKGSQPISQVFIASYLETHHVEADKIDFRELSDDRYFEAVGAVLLAPIITSFMVWMKDNMSKRGIDRAVFLARDGQFPKAVFDLLWPVGFETNYIAASRRLLTLPFTELDPDTIHGMFRPTVASSETLDQFLSKIAAGPEMRALFEKTDLFDADALSRKQIKNILTTLQENPDVVHSSFKGEHETLKKYYRAAFPSNSRSALFDVGWRGSLQHSISGLHARDAQVTGLYFGTRLSANTLLQRNGLDYDSYSIHNGLPIQKKKWAKDFSDIIEFLLSADHGSVIGISESSSGEFTWRTANVSDVEKHTQTVAKKIQKAALCAIETVLKTMPIEVLARYTSPEDEVDLRQFLTNPHRHDAERFKSIRVFAGVGDTTGESLTRIGERGSHYRNAKLSRWREAYVSQLNGLSGAWVNFLLRKRKKIGL